MVTNLISINDYFTYTSMHMLSFFFHSAGHIITFRARIYALSKDIDVALWIDYRALTYGKARCLRTLAYYLMSSLNLNDYCQCMGPRCN